MTAPTEKQLQLHGFITRVAALMKEKEAVSESIKLELETAKAAGFNPKFIRNTIKRRSDPELHTEVTHTEDAYFHAAAHVDQTIAAARATDPKENPPHD